jgi:septal ring-binding cell division protein DamX
MTNKLFISLMFSVCFLSSLKAQSALEKADKQYELNNFEGALQSYSKALKATPNSDIIQSKMADTYRKLGKFDDAILWYEKAALKGDEANTIQLGKMYMRKGNYNKAKQTFAKISAKNAEAKHFEESCDEANKVLTDNSIYKATNIASLNSQFDDYLPSFTTNGSIVYLSSRNDMQRKGSKTPVGSNQLFTTSFEDENFKKPTFFNVDLKNNYNEGPISEAGNYAVITQNNFIGGVQPMETKGLELSMKKATIDKSTGHWQNSQSLSLGGEGYANGFGALSEDGMRLVFASDRPGGQGGFDLYECKRVGESWSVPINLGEINTPGNEITPFLLGENLYFSSDYHTGLGGYDVFRAEVSNGIYNDLYHLGNQVNSGGDDYGFIYNSSKDFGLLTSNRDGGKGGEDLYLITKTAKKLTINCIDEDGKPIAKAKIDLSKCDEETVTADNNGNYSMQIIGEIDCAAVVSKEGFTSVTKSIKASGSKNQTITIELKKAAPMFIGTVTDIDGNLVSDVYVKATNTANQKKLEAYSDEKGKYALPLDANSDYLLNFSKSGFINLTVNKKGLDAKNRDLGTAKMKTVAEQYNVENVFPPAVDEKDDIVFTSKGASTTSSPAKFTIQLASVKDKNTDLSSFQKALKDVGEVYITESANNIYKIKVGKFATREAAIDAMKKVKDAGFQGIITPGISGGKTAVKPTNLIPLAQPEEGMSNYHVRLETLSKPENFLASKVERIGQITTMKSGELTIFMLSNFKNLDQARKAKEAAVNAGFKGAYVVEKKGDKLTKVE